MNFLKSVAIGSSWLVVLLTGCNYPQNRHVYGGTAADSDQVISSGSYDGPNTVSPPPTYSTPPTPPPVIGGNTSPTPISPDAMLLDRVNQALRSSSLGVAPNNISVTAQNGAVTLNGNVPTERQRQMIDDLVRNTSGVLSVNDQLQVSSAYSSGYPQGSSTYSPAPSAQTVIPPAATGDIFNLHVKGLNEADRQLAQRILQGLRSDSRLGSLLPTVDINVAQGRVILQGMVQNEQQRSAIEAAVRQAAGGSYVEDQLQLQGGSPPLPQ